MRILEAATHSIVPTYDGQSAVSDGSTAQPFRFTPQDFDALPSWPSYLSNTSEIPLDSVVAIGFTTGTYAFNDEKWALFVIFYPDKQYFLIISCSYLSMNIRCVIVLHTPTLTIGINPPLGPAPTLNRTCVKRYKTASSK
ncbi:hypothetical protein C0992_004784 [Termitomyces sp. T32_za158]|nr:hypothetical protein C0992_004784 [Termitomyces sp. T32_za158]